MPLPSLALPGLILFSILIIKAVPVLGNTHAGGQVQQTAEKTVVTDARTQKTVESWVDEEEALMDRIEAAESQLKHTLWRQKKNKIFLKNLILKIEDLKAQAAEMEKVEFELLPVLDDALDRLWEFVKSDLPMDLEQRRKYMNATQSLLNDYDKGLLLKTRMVFDTLSREVDRGYTVGVKEDEINAGGKLKQVKLLRVGRIGLFALTPDGRSAYAWDRDLGKFTLLDGPAREILQAIEMAEGVRIIGLSRISVTLPGSSGTSEPEVQKGGSSIETD